MIVHKIHDLSNAYVVSLLEKGLSEIDEIQENYSPKFKHVNSNLFYILENGRYKNGAYYVIENNGEFVGSAGWNKYEYIDDTALVLTRAYISKIYRNKYIMANVLLPKIIEECRDYTNIWITCNEHNKRIYNWLSRNKSEKSLWPEFYLNFEPIGIKEIYFTQQYVLALKKQ